MIREAPCLKFHNIKFNRNQTRQISPCSHKQKENCRITYTKLRLFRSKKRKIQFVYPQKDYNST